ncbi:sideroflexin [Acrasis kona]|uniref:Sideroflexin n=1 Tax=Acrasis kona TaxID=1008807 RepID=A0AAW2ZRL7_9EUKA
MAEGQVKKPTYLLSASQHDLNTYWGRVKHFANVTDIRTLFTTTKRLEEAQNVLKRAEQPDGSPNLPSQEEVWEAKRIRDSMVHPDTGSIIPAPFRFSAFLPSNLGIVVGMLTAKSIPSIVLWQTVNQTYNVCVNYSNRNASSETSNKQLGISFAGALASSVGTAVGLNQWITHTKSITNPIMRQRLNSFVPFVAVGVANMFNITLMRITELQQGIDVKDEDGNVVGKSVIAGQRAISQTIFSRIMLITPGMVFPPIIMNLMESKTQLFVKRPWIKTPFYVGMLAFFIGAFLPLCIGLFPQQSKISVDSVEPSIRDKLKGTNKKFLYYNKGL